MLGSLLDYWKSLTALGTVSLPLVGLFFLSTKSINWTSPFGYYTKLRLFIKKNVSTSQTTVATSETPTSSTGINNQYQLTQVSSGSVTQGSETPDLIAEYQITSLDKENWWKYCLPKSSKLKQNGQIQAVSSPVTSEGECELQYFKKGSKEIDYLLKLGLKFLKLQHQINLFLFYSSEKQTPPIIKDSSDTSGWDTQLLAKCSLKTSNGNESALKGFFVSTSPASPNCLLVPNQVDLHLTIGGGAEQAKVESSSSPELKLDDIKKGTISGNISYSFSDYWGKLQDFTWNNGTLTNGATSNTQTTNNPVLISLKPVEKKNFEFQLESVTNYSSSDGQTYLKFEDLYKKYETRDLQLCDFWKKSETAGGGNNQLCRSSSQK